MSDQSTNGDDWDAISLSRDEYVATITLSRPDAMNTFSTVMATELDEALTRFDATNDIRAIIIEGAGPTFSAGIDLTEYREHSSKASYESWVTGMESPFITITEIHTPVIAAVHGHAAANGIGLVAACDLAVATEDAKFGATAPKVGLFCMGPAVPLMHSLPRKQCLELLLTGELIDAETAKAWGLINRVVPNGSHISAAFELAETIGSKSPEAIQRGKSAFYEMVNMDYTTALEHSNAQFATLCTTTEAEKGIDAFLSGNPLSTEDW